jgi:hypothetical protein
LLPSADAGFQNLNPKNPKPFKQIPYPKIYKNRKRIPNPNKPITLRNPYPETTLNPSAVVAQVYYIQIKYIE